MDPPTVHRRSRPSSAHAGIGVATTLMLSVSFAVVLIPVVGLLSGHWRVVPVLSGSMEPAIPTGGVLIVTPVAVSEIQAGQVILYRIPIGDRHVEAHRIVRVISSGDHPVVITQGDANETADPWLARLDGPVVWRARFAIPEVGRAIMFLRHSLARAVMMTAAAALLLGVGLRWTWAGSTPEEDRNDAPSPA